jgi:hypothetical protein
VGDFGPGTRRTCDRLSILELALAHKVGAIFVWTFIPIFILTFILIPIYFYLRIDFYPHFQFLS